MLRMSSSRASLAISLVALFVALGGTALAVSKIGTSQIKSGAVTAKKLHSAAVTRGKIKAGAVGSGQLADGAVSSAKLAPNAVTTGAIADNAVTSAKVADHSLTAGDVAPNTFLAADGTAADSSKLGGLSPNAYVFGQGKLRSARLSLSPASPFTEFLELDFGHISGVCDAGLNGKIRFVADLPVDNLIFWIVNSGGTVDIQAHNSVGAGSSYDVSHTGGLPQSVTFQATYNDGSQEHLATAWTTVQTVNNECVFTGQAITTL
jgi:hypothetical protein